jgi:hypothetical protein
MPPLAAAAAAAARRATHAAAAHAAAAHAAALPSALRLGNIGQPTPETHPRLLAPGELTPGISGGEYAARRAALAAAMPPDSVAVIAAAPVIKYHGTAIPVPSAYRQARARACGGLPVVITPAGCVERSRKNFS